MNTRFLKVTFVDCGTRIDIPATDTTKVLINAERADGQSKGFDGVINEDGTVTVPLHSWMLELEGTVVCDISVIDTAADAEKKLTTTSFTLFVEKAAYGGSDVTTDPQYDVLVDLITEVEKIIANGGGSGKSGLSTWKVDVDLSESLRVIPPDLPYIEGRELQVGDLVIDSLGKMYRVIEIDPRSNAGTLEDLSFSIKGEKGEQGNSGVYVGSGDMPDGYNIQVDPEAESDFDEMVETVIKNNTDNVYNAESQNPQSGVAVAQAIETALSNFVNVEVNGQ
jgi:hypothetical protein